MGMTYLSSVLKKAGHHVRCFDGSAPYRVHKNEDLVEACKKVDPDVICVTTTTERVRFAYHLLYLLKNHFNEIPIIVGGPHASSRPVEMVAHGFDIAVAGYAENRITQIIDIAVYRDTARLETVSGIAFCEPTGGIRYIPPGKEEDDFDINCLLPVDFSSFDMKDYTRRKDDSYRLGLLLAGRGCPGRCTYCSQVIFGTKIKMSSANKIIDDIVNRKKQFAVNHFYFYDDTLLRDKDTVNHLCKLMSSNGDLSEITWGRNARPNIVDRQLLRNMKEAGCRGIALGVESGNPETLTRIKKGIQLETMLNCIDAIIESGIGVQVNLMNGFPWDNAQTVRINATLVEKLITKGVSRVSPTHTVFPYPGTELYEETYAKGYQVYNWWLRDDFFERLNSKSLYTDQNMGPYYRHFVPLHPRINSREDFYGVYKNKVFKKEIEKMLLIIEKHNLSRKPSRFLKFKAIRCLVAIFGSVLYTISPKVEKLLWKKLFF